MPTAIQLPELGTSRETIRVSGWLVDVGDEVELGDRVVEVKVPGMTFDVPAEVAGVLSRIEKPTNSITVAGDILGWIDAR